MKTKTYSHMSLTNAGRSGLGWLHERLGEEVTFSSRYPSIRVSGPLIVLSSIPVAAGLLQVIGDGDDGVYEWIWFLHDGSARYSAMGFGSISHALFDGLKHALAEDFA
jgi:hypothetical protein